MYLHIGNGKLIKQEEIIGIFDFDTATITKNTKKWISKKQQDKKIELVTMDIPKSFILMSEKEDNKVYLSQLSPKTLVSRAGKIGINKIY